MIGLWSWLLTGLALFIIWLSGRRLRASWWLGIATQALWVAFGLQTGQYGFVATAPIFAAVYLHNIRTGTEGRAHQCCSRPSP